MQSVFGESVFVPHWLLKQAAIRVVVTPIEAHSVYQASGTQVEPSASKIAPAQLLGSDVLIMDAGSISMSQLVTLTKTLTKCLLDK